MNLIHFRGLNCYFNCVVSIAAHLGLKYEDSFATLWSETDFFYDGRLNAYSTKRMLKNLEAMGVRFRRIGCASIEGAEKGLSPSQAGELMIIGMDAFYIPWSPIYKALHDPHYFFARQEESDCFLCFDPTYNQKNMWITRDNIIPNAFDICRVEKVAQKPLLVGVMEEAQEIADAHPQTQRELLSEINECALEKRKNAARLAKYIDALINNRYLFRRYLQNSTPDPAVSQCFDKDFFVRWEAVKNGLYKASLIANNEGVLNEVCKLFDHLMNEEIVIAKQLMPLK